jgi:hypothetical protein
MNEDVETTTVEATVETSTVPGKIKLSKYYIQNYYRLY